MYDVYFTHDAKKDYKKIVNSNLKKKIHTLLKLIEDDPFNNPPPYKKLRGNYTGLYSRRINVKHRLFYQVDIQNKRIKILRMWSHYGDN